MIAFYCCFCPPRRCSFFAYATKTSRTLEDEDKEESREKISLEGDVAKEVGIKLEGESEDYDVTEAEELPRDHRGLKEKEFKFEEDLEAELYSRGFEDLPVVLDPKSCKARMPFRAHKKVLSEYAQLFLDDWKGVASVINSANNLTYNRHLRVEKFIQAHLTLLFGPRQHAHSTFMPTTYSTIFFVDPSRFLVAAPFPTLSCGSQRPRL